MPIRKIPQLPPPSLPKITSNTPTTDPFQTSNDVINGSLDVTSIASRLADSRSNSSVTSSVEWSDVTVKIDSDVANGVYSGVTGKAECGVTGRGYSDVTRGNDITDSGRRASGVENVYWHLTEADRDTVLRTRCKGEDEVDTAADSKKPIGVFYGSSLIEREFLDLQMREKELQAKRHPVLDNQAETRNDKNDHGNHGSNCHSNALNLPDTNATYRRSSYSVYENSKMHKSATDGHLSTLFNKPSNSIGWPVNRSTNKTDEVGVRANSVRLSASANITDLAVIRDNLNSGLSLVDEIVEADRPDYLEKITREMEEVTRRENELKERRKSCIPFNEDQIDISLPRSDSQITSPTPIVLKPANALASVPKLRNTLATVAKQNYRPTACDNQITVEKSDDGCRSNRLTAVANDDDDSDSVVKTIFTTESPIQREIRIVEARELDLRITKLEIQKELAGVNLGATPLATQKNFRTPSLTTSHRVATLNAAPIDPSHAPVPTPSSPRPLQNYNQNRRYSIGMLESPSDEKLLMSESKIEAEMREILKREEELRLKRRIDEKN